MMISTPTTPSPLPSSHQVTLTPPRSISTTASTTPDSATAMANNTNTIPASRSTGSLNSLVNRRSNPIISTEDGDDDADTDAESLANHLRASLSMTPNVKVMPESARSMLPAVEQRPPLAPEAAPAAGAVNNDTSMNIDVDEMNSHHNIAMADSVEMSLGGINKYLPNSISSNNGEGNNGENKVSPLSSRRSSFESDSVQQEQQQQQQQQQQIISIPSTVSNISNNTNTTEKSKSSVSISQRDTERARNNNNSNNKNTNNDNTTNSKKGDFDFDATLHNQKKGTGYLASQISLSTPTDVFANGCTLLQLCAIGNPSAVKEYVSAKFDNVNFRDYDRRTALHVAASEGHLDVVKYLVQKGVNVNRSDRWGGSPLDDAHRHRHTDVARYLRSKGARTGSLNLTSNLIAAAAAGDMEEVRMICGGGNNEKALDWSSGVQHRTTRISNNVGDGNKNQPSALDQSGSRGRRAVAAHNINKQSTLDMSEPTFKSSINAVDINRGDYDKRTALHLAAGEGHLDVVQFLIQMGANVNAEDRWGGRPIDDALQRGNDRVAAALKRKGAISAYNDSMTGSSLSHFRKSSSVLCDNGGGDPSSSLAVSSNHERDDDEIFRVDFSELEMIERIGSGAFGEIYKCRWRGILVAAKCIKASKIQKDWLLKNRSHLDKRDHIRNRIEAIKQTCITEDEKQLALEDFRRETAIMRRLRHPNIVMMLGYSHTQDVEVMISEICRCSLLDIFKANNISNSQIPKRTQIVYAQQLAQGMNHLHKSRPPIIHRDLKPANLLVDFSGTLKIADFGLAKIRPDPERDESEAFRMTGETGSYRFMAPEVFRHEEYTETVDVYSYAMIFYYMFRSQPPWAGLSGLDAVTKAAVDGERPLIPRNVDERLSTLLKRCWDENYRARPSFEEIIMCLNVYSHDVFKTNDMEVVSAGGHIGHPDSKCGCVIS